MNLQLLKHLRLLLAILFASPFAGDVFAQRDGGTVDLDTLPESTPVMVRSGNSNTALVLQTAFRIHGGFGLVETAKEADFVVQVEPLGPRGARLAISSGVPEKVLFTETLAGDTSLNAVYKAIDRAIGKMRRTTGFFSGKIAFVSEETGNTEVCVSDLLFQNIVMLTRDGVNAVRPHWSPDGNYIMYTSYKSGFPDIYRLDLRAQRRDVVANYPGLNMGARYSPDGSRVAMIVSGKGNADVWVRDGVGTMRNLTKSRGLEAAPAWSPDGTRLVYSSDERGGPQLYVIPSNGGTPRRLRTDISGYCAEPDWNPVFDNLIVFTAAEGSGSQIAIYDSKAGGSKFITTESGDAIEPQWLSDGRHIVYTHRRANRSEIKIMDTLSRKSYVISGSRLKVSQASFVK